MGANIELDLTVIPENFDPDSPEWIRICNNLHSSLEADDDIILSAPKPDLVPKDVKGEPVTVGAFVIAVASAPAIVRLVGALNAWIKNLGGRKVKITIQTRGQKLTAEATGFSKRNIEDLVKLASRALPNG
jgi:hypothetical protein